MGDVFSEYLSGCSDMTMVATRILLFIVLAFIFMNDIVALFFLVDSAEASIIALAEIIIISFGAVGAYKKNYKILLFVSIYSMRQI